MGVLDDAIREHLELKRQRGADSDEIARQESEALGPVIRETAAEHQQEQASPPGHVQAAPADQPAADAAPVSADEDPVAATPPPPEPEPVVEPEPIPDPEPVTEPEPDDEPDALAQSVSEPEPDLNPHPTASQPTAQFSSEDVAEAMGRRPLKPPSRRRDRSEAAEEPDSKEHDELEETPEFLQEAPEHDKLWFEQKPPKDFDF